MGKRLDEKELTLYRAVDEVLHYLWDPIGVSEFPQARDEYHSYLPRVFALLRSNADEDELVEYLTKMATEQMGLTPDREHNRTIARILLEWKMVVLDREEP